MSFSTQLRSVDSPPLQVGAVAAIALTQMVQSPRAASGDIATIGAIQAMGDAPGWGSGLLWSVLPAAIGTIIGAFFLVALPLYLASLRDRTDAQPA